MKKEYPRRTKNGKGRGRNWRLKRLAREAGDAEEAGAGGGKGGRGRGVGDKAEREEADYEMFLRDVEEDEEMRGAMDLYKARRAEEAALAKAEGAEAEGMDVDGEGQDGKDEEGEGEEEEEEDDGLEIPMDQLREEFEDMMMEERQGGAGK